MAKRLSNLVSDLNIVSLICLDSIENAFPKHSKMLLDSSDTQMTEKLQIAKISNWSFSFIAAGCGMALISSEKFRGEREQIRKALKETDPQLLDAVKKFIKYIRKNKKKITGTDVFKSYIGYWIIISICKKPPTDDEIMDLSFPVGHLLATTVGDLRK